MLCPNGFGKSNVKSHFLEEPFESNEPWEIPTMYYSIWYPNDLVMKPFTPVACSSTRGI